MSVALRELYRSSNGDRWSIGREPNSERVFIRHEPNAPSGGQPIDISIAEFLAQDVHGPEHMELLRLIGTLVEGSTRAPGLSG